MDYAVEVAKRAQNWHETDHGSRRGEPIMGDTFVQPGNDDVPDSLPASFRTCPLCKPCAPAWSMAKHTNPFWFQVVAWEAES